MKKIIASTLLLFVYFSALAEERQIKLTSISKVALSFFNEEQKITKKDLINCCNEIENITELELQAFRKKSRTEITNIEQVKIDVAAAQIKQMINEKSNNNPLDKALLQLEVIQFLDQAEEHLNKLVDESSDSK
jgi:hypothetical protein